MKKQVAAALPLVLPLTDLQGQPCVNACRLIFPNAFTLYYSYQHPIAFFSRERLVLRAKFWDRRRGERAGHIEQILLDVQKQLGKSVDTAEMASDFFVEVQEEMVYHGLAAGAKAGVSERKPGSAKRRVVL